MLELTVYGIVYGSVIALGAIGLTLIYGILRFGNFAHGDLMAVGAYVALFFVAVALPLLGIPETRFEPLSFGWRMVIAIPLAMAATALLAVVLDRAVYRPLRHRKSSPVMLSMAALGVAFLIRSLIYILWGPDPTRYVEGLLRIPIYLPFDIKVRPDQVVILVLTLLLVMMLYLFLQKTRLGKAMRATADNPDLARISGINTERIALLTWVIGGALAGAAGIFWAIDSQLTPEMGWGFLLPLFAAVILGGIGSPYGALAGGLIIGIVQQVSTAFINPAYKPAVAFALLILILLVRPQGIFGGRS
ncbi:MAG: branched-chain amino acid ABC transporter permease [Candidatus Bipolaricaulota bacterium]|nr:branched-chain amino acid ABC transporter permease [Candidatus Bipolaricaulota bacterium]MCS7274265.1 branched-chain amino acid ABC transporter permease [Candidatus Bipolaricaulota bacterium]MDW8111049.1 branched-chain amino acid ABC transporter permease [Candidatus Bipolaricaulota bacterium]MDW8329764.1 branched-chain amino acid ABC transporter permease [Candidatus Bipolaricaulota bacterium]